MQFKPADDLNSEHDNTMLIGDKLKSLEVMNQNQLVYVLSMLVSSTRWHVPYGLVEAQE